MANTEHIERMIMLLFGLFSTLKIALAVEISDVFNFDKFISIFPDFDFRSILKKRKEKTIDMKNASAFHLNTANIQEYMTIFGHTTRTAASNIATIKDRGDSSLIFATPPTLASPPDLKSKISTAVELRDMTLVRIDP